VSGATIELIRIDNAGNQVGDVLATALTSITGGYTLTLPAGVNLAGNLIVHITGTGNNELRAQVVEEAVDISPLSEFVLRKFIENGADLSTIETAAVVKLSGQVEAFDLTAGSDLAVLFEQLEFSAGEFVDSQIDALQSSPANATGLSGEYRSAALQIALVDGDGRDFGAYVLDQWSSNFTFTGNADGAVVIEDNNEESVRGYVYGTDASLTELDYQVLTDNDSETLQARFDDTNTLMVENEFEENIDGDIGWRSPPVTYRLQKVRDQNIFFLLNQEASVRYATIDTDGDNVDDAVDPGAREGDEVARGIEVFAKKPTAMTTADLSGAFGRVYFGAFLAASGHIEMEMETNILEFASGLFDYGIAERNSISRNSMGQVNATAETTPAEENLAIRVDVDGDILSIGGEPTAGFVNDAANLVVFSESEGVDASEANFSKTFLIKLPTTPPSVANKRYRLMFIDSQFAGTAFEVNNSRFNSFIAWNSNGTGTLALEATTISKSSLGANVIGTAHPANERAVTAEIAANGAGTINITDAEGTLRLKGYWNETASYGVFTAGYLPSGETAFGSIGVAVLTEVAE
jgi:hypothetical protein